MPNSVIQKTEWLKDLQLTNTRFLDLLGSFDNNRLNEIPFPGSWTAGQVAEHIHKSDLGMIFLLTGPVRKDSREPDQEVKKIQQVFLDFDSKLKSPDFIIPENKKYNRESILSRFESDRNSIIEILETADLTETCTARPFPGIGELTRLEIFSFILSHTKRHVHQLERISQKNAG